MNKRQNKKQKKKADKISTLLMAPSPKTKKDIKDLAELSNMIKSVTLIPSNEKEEKMLKDAGIPYLKEWREFKANEEKFIAQNQAKLNKARIKN